MIIQVHVKDLVFPIQCAGGCQPLRWLGHVACQRYGLEKGHLHQQQFLPQGVRDEEGVLHDPSKLINAVFGDNSDAYIDISGGTKAFTMRWDGRPITPLYAMEELEEVEEVVLTPENKQAADLKWIKKIDFRKFGIDKLVMGDLKRMTEQEVDSHARSFKDRSRLSGYGALKAARDFNSNRLDQISIRKGEMVNILENQDPVWWKGEINGKVGLFPAGCLEFDIAIASRDFTGTKPDEINFQKGEIITILDKSDQKMWKGQIPPRIGKFPRAFITLLPRHENGDINSGTKMIAISDSNPAASDDLYFSKGDVINVLDISRNDRWKGALNGAMGYFPPNLVCLLQDAGIGAAKARRDHPGLKPGELAFKRGDRIIILDKLNEDMWKGFVNNRVGLFPASFVDPEQFVAMVPNEDRRNGDLHFPKFALINILDCSDGDKWKGEYHGKIGFIDPGNIIRAEQYPALKDYKAMRGEELSLRKGDLITILDKSDPVFFLANVNDSVGFIPKSLLTLSDAKTEDANTEVISIRDYSAKSPDELTFPKFAVIQVLDCSDDEMWKGKYNGKVGKFPRSHIEPLLGQKLVDSPFGSAEKGKRQYNKEDVLESEFSELRNFLIEKAGFFRNLFSYYATVNTVGYTDVNTMSNAQFMSFAKECKLMTTQIRPADIDIIFVASIVHTTMEKSSSRGEQERNMVIQEFVAGIIRIAHAKYRHLSKLIDRVRSMYEQDVKPNGMPFMMDLAKKFKTLYSPSVRLIIDNYSVQLSAIFNEFVFEDRIQNNRLPFNKVLSICKQWDLFGTDKLSIFLLRMIFMYSTAAADDNIDVEWNKYVADVDLDQFTTIIVCAARHFHSMLDNPDSIDFHKYLDKFMSQLM